MKVLKLKETYVVFIETIGKSISFNEFIDDEGKSYFCRLSVLHYLDITKINCLGHSLKEAIKTLDQSNKKIITDNTLDTNCNCSLFHLIKPLLEVGIHT